VYSVALRAAAIALAVTSWIAVPLRAQVATPKVVAYVQIALQHGDLASASALVAQYRRLNGDTPEALEALSWVARGELAAGRRDQASADATTIQDKCRAALATRKLDAEPHLPLALGAAYEVRAELLLEHQQRPEALEMLRAALHTWQGTSLVDRLQKCINMLTLEGRPMPVFRETEWIGTKPSAPLAWRGKVVLLFFWAHWCADCKAEAPVIANLSSQLGPKGLIIVAPTRRYGYTAADEHAPPAEENAFIQKVFDRFYANIPGIQVPLDASDRPSRHRAPLSSRRHR
jgi:thiol-disulfide isomerase/thioredoxin